MIGNLRHTDCIASCVRCPSQNRMWGGKGGAPGGVAATGGVTPALLAGLVLRLRADDLLVQAVIEGALHTAHGHPLVYVLTGRQG